MDKKKFRTRPFVLAEFISVVIALLVVDISTIFKPEVVSNDWRMFLLINLLLIVIMIMYIEQGKAFNLIKFSSQGMFHKNGTYDWDAIHITAFLRNKTGTSSPTYCFAFSDRFLTFQEAHGNAYKKGLCLFINKRRLEYFLSGCKREIHILTTERKEIRKSKSLSEITERIEEHNNAIRQNSNENTDFTIK